MAEVLLALFRNWELEPEQQAGLLGMEEVDSLWQGAALPDRTVVLERAGLLLAIDRNLGKKYADQPLLRERWVSNPNIWLRGRSPLQRMLEGLEGIREVAALVEQMVPPEELPPDA